MRNVSVRAVVAYWNYPLVVTTIRQCQWYCTVAINRAQKTARPTPYAMALFSTVQSCLWSGKTVWLSGICPGPRCGAYRTYRTVAGGEGAGCPLSNNPAADCALLASILGPSGLSLLGSVLDPSLLKKCSIIKSLITDSIILLITLVRLMSL